MRHVLLLAAAAALASIPFQARAQVEAPGAAAAPAPELFAVPSDAQVEHFSQFTAWLKGDGGEPYILRDPDLQSLASLDLKRPESRDVVAPLAASLSNKEVEGLSVMTLQPGVEKRRLLEAIERARIKAAPAVEARLVGRLEEAERSGDELELARIANLEEGYSFYGDFVRGIKVRAAEALSVRANRRVESAARALAAPGTAAAEDSASAAAGADAEPAAEPQTRARVETTAIEKARVLESDPPRFKAAVEILRNMHPLREAGRYSMIHEALDYVLDYAGQKSYSEEARALAFDVKIRGLLQAAPDAYGIKEKAVRLKSRLEHLVSEAAVNDIGRTRFHRRSVSALLVAFAACLEAAIRTGNGWAITGSVIFGLVGGIWGVIGLFGGAFWNKGKEVKESIRDYKAHFEYFNDTASMRKKVLRKFRKFHARQLVLESRALRLEGDFDAARGKFDPEAHLHKGEAFDIGIAKLLRSENYFVREEARKLLEEMIGLEILDSRREDDREALAQLGLHLHMLESSDPERSPAIMKDRVVLLIQSTLKRADAQHNDEFYADLAQSLEAGADAAAAALPRTRVAEPEEAEAVSQPAEEVEKVRKAPRS